MERFAAAGEIEVGNEKLRIWFFGEACFRRWHRRDGCDFGPCGIGGFLDPWSGGFSAQSLPAKGQGAFCGARTIG